MAKIIMTKNNEWVFEECCDRGVTFMDHVLTWVEHNKCSNCGAEVDIDSKFCKSCGERFTGKVKKY